MERSRSKIEERHSSEITNIFDIGENKNSGGSQDICQHSPNKLEAMISSLVSTMISGSLEIGTQTSVDTP